MSFYITLRDDRGQERTVWGVDLRRVACETNLEVGQRVILEFLGKTAVDVSEPVRNVHGAVVGHRKVRTHRNTWRATVVGGSTQAVTSSGIVNPDRDDGQ